MGEGEVCEGEGEREGRRVRERERENGKFHLGIIYIPLTHLPLVCDVDNELLVLYFYLPLLG